MSGHVKNAPMLLLIGSLSTKVLVELILETGSLDSVKAFDFKMFLYEYCRLCLYLFF